MKRYLITIMAFLAFGLGCAVNSQDVISDSAENTEIRIYEVFGMDCPGCHGGLEKLVKKIPSVQQAEANWEKQRLTISVRPGMELDDNDVYDAIQRANFTVGNRIR